MRDWRVFSFSAVGVQGESFDFTLQLYGAIIPEGCKTNVGLRNIICSIQKQEKGWWKRLLKSEEKPAPYLKVDWNKWCDEDDEETNSDLASDDDNIAYGEDDEGSDDEGMLCELQLDHFYKTVMSNYKISSIWALIAYTLCKS
ncbi:hypothetical protein GH714_022388 [Hevea brasiliensis]|uniref:Co-chaperone protein p23 n=1 Tax=Hevea brasiliensis TaxID=3981 RepID=A0A6A6M3G6_HEVBR|nr:hypothetical protein GH714_022388 [Hevea brasiliensis]